MKDKFEEAIKDHCNYCDEYISKIAKVCNTLHQQAMKKLLKENNRLKVIIFNLEDKIAEIENTI